MNNIYVCGFFASRRHSHPKMGSVSPVPKLYIFYGPKSTEGVHVYNASMAAWVGAQEDNRGVCHINFYYGCMSAQTIPSFPSRNMNINGPKLSACMISGLLN